MDDGAQWIALAIVAALALAAAVVAHRSAKDAPGRALATFAGVIGAVLVLMVASQVSGFNMYTGDELESAQTERLRDEARELEDALGPSGPEEAVTPSECDAAGGIWNPGQQTCYPE